MDPSASQVGVDPTLCHTHVVPNDPVAFIDSLVSSLTKTVNCGLGPLRQAAGASKQLSKTRMPLLPSCAPHPQKVQPPSPSSAPKAPLCLKVPTNGANKNIQKVSRFKEMHNGDEGKNKVGGPYMDHQSVGGKDFKF